MTKAMEKLGVDSLDNLINFFDDDEWEHFLSMFKILDVIGSGGFGVVLKALDIKHNKKVALKVVVKSDRKGEMLMQEYEILA